ncbi:DUF4184 family protein [Nocardiopsis sp. EMB25]|uniref:DUF4184 family protein n=1 Tax=Nocardiopsis TaxID=2013 RepID=UPI00034560C7|nr:MULTISPECIES: DUF4184 family protein [Nocardiopsis]MCY9783356.1 DUF4184 family protein [Nocardiopsis sp. EMB25]
MPFTISHAAAVLPLARTRLPTAALVVGAVVPDLPYYLPLPVSSAHTHQPWGLGADVLMGAVVLVLYRYALRAPLLALASRADGGPGERSGPLPRSVPLTVAALAVGALTHMVWDSFTQLGGAVVRAWPVLSTPVVGPHLLFNVLMYASSAVGLAAVAWWAVRRVRAGERGGAGLDRGARGAVLGGIAVCATAGAVVAVLTAMPAPSPYDAVRDLLIGSVTGGCAGLGGYTVGWWGLRAARAVGGSGTTVDHGADHSR